LGSYLFKIEEFTEIIKYVFNLLSNLKDRIRRKS
jgi:hypothetical protein